MTIETPFHAGELEAQRLAGETAIAQRNSAVISDAIITGALPFLKQQRMVLLGTASNDGALWASPLFGAPGFVTPEDPRTLRFDQRLIRPAEADVLWRNLRPGARAGMLAIDLATRRRLRVNGTIERVLDGEFILAVQEAYPNCPKYIQRRTLSWLDEAPAEPAPQVSSGSDLSGEAARILDAADTLFIASAHIERGVDVSHRGGNPGFLQRLNATMFRVPDYAGNSMFNTLGNLIVDPRAGVTVMDFAGNRMLRMTGAAKVEWKQPDVDGLTGGTGRFWTFNIERWQLLPLPIQARWEFLDASPYNPRPSAAGSAPRG
ncbi:MAG: pyridoxamine 5'-phosphate oxidase family protein [Acidobacteria bacterium]|nr:pyridoxamine 5'-phosphate oxidase family protein [Acidobacteriota bacterium]